METNKDILRNKVEEQKIQNKNYLRELQRFFDLADNIPNERLRKRIIYQMLKCDETITKVLEEKI